MFGAVANNFDLMIHAQPGAGKTFFVLKMANYIANNIGPVLFVSTEEFGSRTLADKINETGSHSQNLHFAGNITDVDLSQYVAVFLDSVNDAGISLAEYKNIREQNPQLAAVLILQKNKKGEFKGGKDWEHEVEIAAELTKDGNTRHINVYKNRYGVMGDKKI